MTIIRDFDTPTEDANLLIKKLGLEGKPTFELNDQSDPDLAPCDSVLMISTMRAGPLNYHQQFFEKYCKNIPLWTILILNDDPVVLRLSKAIFTPKKVRSQVIQVTQDTDYEALTAAFLAFSRINPRKALLYSIRPNCGKKTLAAYLSAKCPSWTFETAEEDLGTDKLAETDAGLIMIVGKTLTDFSVDIPGDVTPVYILTMPDENVQMYLNFSEMPNLMLDYIPAKLKWTREVAEKHLYYISPLYESWRDNHTIPAHDPRFIMWDRFGLPLLQSSNTDTAIMDFLSQFQQTDKLIEQYFE